MVIEEVIIKINRINHIDYKMYLNYNDGVINVDFYNKQYKRCRKMITIIVEQYAKEQAIEFSKWIDKTAQDLPINYNGLHAKFITNQCLNI